MDKLTEMTVFAEVARCEGLSAAGRELGLSPSAVSKILNRLEERLGVRLLNRTTRQVNLTEAGQEFLAHCQSIVADIEAAEDSLADYGSEPRGIITVNSTAGFARYKLLPLLPKFQQQYPNLTVNLQLSGDTVDLVAEGVDVAIRLGQLQDNRLVARKLYQCPRIVCASPDYLQRHGYPNRPQELEFHNCLRLSTSAVFNQWHFHSVEGEQRVEVNGTFITDQVEALHQHALAGGGVVRLAEFMLAEDIAQGRLIPVLRDFDCGTQSVHAVFTHRELMPTKVRAFVDYLVGSLG
ncbi:LysR family transcriptional regulator [Pseudomaricurvus alkylphenolicus]|jgi:DNA-binding transcriptional LysR family regulator|uniref:LysR family transcriptional regulator n=1 Tax=Pseudomaricurvus alkylphenolicus TaxID=1306991 RepID=UPI001420547B|nr:LysR family transcriptional regulator [Pseudomaricurvus alkylphenolicus]NIB42276.1 LysR family transcriptional regulator [Pseudomaricurvus alkylphenolicus]